MPHSNVPNHSFCRAPPCRERRSRPRYPTACEDGGPRGDLSLSGPRSHPVVAVGNDGLGSAILQPLTQLGTVVGLVADQEDGEKTAPSICECVDLCVAPASRAANRLLLLLPFPPAAERCGLTCAESIICVVADLPFPASSRNKFSQTPRRAQRTKRL